ncbi:MAG: polysaccharide pyruvyl transferase family protein [Planctomycetota bacterium]|jgi:glycosyltransferase involved in cell wall biosynthesis/polysaccharide pyruvyl transferase WcaK-like protein
MSTEIGDSALGCDTPTVCIYSNNFLPISKVWLYRQLRGVSGVRKVVVTKEVMNEDVFPFAPICCLPRRMTKPSIGDYQDYWRRFFQSQAVRLVHVHFANSALEVLPLTRELGIPLLVTLHGSDVYRLGRLPGYMLRYHALFRHASRFLAVSSAIRNEVIRMGCPPEKVHTHYIGAPLSTFQYQERVLRPPNVVRFLNVSNFSPFKGIPVLVRAFGQVHSVLPTSELLLVGKGEEMEACRGLVSELRLEEAVRFVGPLPPQGISQLMHQCHILVHPSVIAHDGAREGLPSSLMEAMATGMPIISTRTGGITEIIVDGKTGCLVEQKNENQLAEQMIALAQNPQIWAKLTKAGLHHVRAKFDLDRQNSRLGDIYRDLMEAPLPSKEPLTRVLITDKVALNGGDAAIMAAMVHGIGCELNCDIRVLAHDWRKVKQLWPGLTILPALEEARFHEREKVIYTPSRRWGFLVRLAAGMKRLFGVYLVELKRQERRVLDNYEWSDVVVSSGGSFLTDNYITLGNKIYAFQVARIMGKPLVIYAQSLGPFRDPRKRRDVGRVLCNAALVIVRDRSSLAVARSLGVPEAKLHLSADAAFNLPSLVPSGGSQMPVAHSGEADRLNIALSVRDWKFPNYPGRKREMMGAYKHAISRLCEHLVVKHRARLTFVSTCQGIPGYVDDSEVAQEIVAALPGSVSERVTVNTEYHNPLDLRIILSGFDAYIATRMHSLILAILSYVPVIGIAYEQKTADLLAELGLDDYLLSIDNSRQQEYMAAADRLIDHCSEVRTLLESKVPQLVNRAAKSVQLLKELVEGCVG